MDIERSCEDYRKVETALRFISENFYKKPSLGEIAFSSGLSEYHFHRLFTRWAGISPGRFMKYLSKEHARAVLRDSRNLLEATYRSGLSSTSRLHDLIVTTEAVSPGQMRSRGAGVGISYGLHPSPFGECLIAVTDKGICHFSFIPDNDPDAAVSGLIAEWCNARIVRDQSVTDGLVDKVFNLPQDRSRSRLNLYIRGTNFQLKVWEALMRIPPGCMVSYEDVAYIAGRPDAVRAAASAVARNPVSYIIPCHRVIRKMGVINDYRWGRDKKMAILGRELSETDETIE